MTKRSALMLVPLAALMLGACDQLSEDENIVPGQSREIHLSGSIGSYTKVSTNAFDAGDEAGLFVGSPVNVTNVKITSDGEGGFTPSEKLYWGAEQKDDESSDFFAYYPYAGDAADAFSFALKTDQTTGDAVTASDFLYAHAAAKPADGGVKLPFNHVMSSFAISVECKVEGHSINAITVDGVKMTASVVLSEGSFAAEGDPVHAKAAPTDNGFFLVVAPQTASPEIILSVSNGEEVSFVPAKPMEFASGKTVRARLVLDMDTVSSFTAEIEDWVDEKISIQGDRPGDCGETHTWSIYNANTEEMFEMEPDDDGIFSARVFGYTTAAPLFIAKDGDPTQLLGQVYNLAYVDEGAEIDLIYTTDAHYAIYLPSNLDVMVFFDPATMKAGWMEVPYDWEEVGEAKFIDGFLAGLFGFNDQEVTVALMESPNYEHTYCLADPYADFRWVYDYEFGYEYSELVFIVKEDNTVYFKNCYTGLSYGNYGSFYAFSLVPENGWSRYSNYGVLDPEYQYISFPETTATACNRGTYLSNQFGKMGITLPGGTRTVIYDTLSDLEVETPDQMSESMTVRFWGLPGIDVRRVSFQVFAGEEAISELIYLSDWTADYFNVEWECPEPGDYTAVFSALDIDDTITDVQSIDFAVAKVDPAYLAWIGGWIINGRDYKISADEAGYSYIMNGFVGGNNVPVSFDPETGDILFYSGVQEDSNYNNGKYQAYRAGYGSDLYLDEVAVMARFHMNEEDPTVATIESALENVYCFGILLYNIEAESLAIASNDDLIDLPVEIYKMQDDGAAGNAPARRPARTLQLPSDATLISKK